MKRIIATFAALVLFASPVMAQQATPQQKSSDAPAVKSMADGMLTGEILADTKGTGGSFAGGFVGGVLLGLIGTGIAYVAQGPADLPAAALVDAQKFGSEYTLGVQQGFAEKSKSKKKKSALTGGLLGTAAFIAVVVSAGS